MKGISIFLALAEKFPDLKFGALPGWGTTSADRSEIEKHRNITLLRSCKNIEQITLIGSPEVYAFHVGWIDSLFAAGESK